MITLGFTCGISNLVTLDVPFTDGNGVPITSTYITIPTTGTEGGIAYYNSNGDPMWKPYAVLGYNPIAAKMIATSVIIDSVTYTTTATPMDWAGSYKG